MSLRILSWNILQGGGSRTDEICEFLKQQQPDVLVLQEFRRGKHDGRLFELFDHLQLSFQHVPDVPDGKNTLAVASRYPIELLDWPTPGNRSADIERRSIFAVRISDTGADLSKHSDSAQSLTLIAAHLPHKKKQIPYFEAILDDADLLRGHSMIIGDLNCGIPFEDSDTKTFSNTHLFQQLLRDGWIDSWRSRHSNSREYTWVSPRGNGYRYDHCLCSPSMDEHIQIVDYLHETREQKFSDHSALFIELSL